MEGAEQPAAERLAQGRTSQACQRCRTLKTRCLPSEQPGTCQRCHNAKRDCQWADLPRRAKKIRGPSRISQVEQKIDGLVASLTRPEPRGPTPTPTPAPCIANQQIQPTPKSPPKVYPGSWVPFPDSFELENERPDQEGAQPEPDTDADSSQLLEKLRLIHSFGHDTDISRPPNNLFQSSGRYEPPVESNLLTDLINSGEAESLLKEYRAMSHSFPFVPLPPAMTAYDLSINKPMLFLAIMTISSFKNHKRQMALDEVYRTELANRTIIRPRRTLSLVQSTLVYLAWYHFIFSHQTQQIFSLLQLSVGLALDLGLHQKTKRMPIEIPGRSAPPLPSPPERRERQRALLGLYYLSSTIAMGMLKPHLLKFTDFMVEACKTLRQEQEYPSDEELHRLLSLRRIDDQIHDAFYVEDVIDLPIADSRISMSLRFMSSQLEEWRRENCGEFTSRVLDLSFPFTELNLNAVGLRPDNSSTQQPNYDPTQINALLACLEAVRRFLDTLLEFPTTQYHHFSMPIWMRLPYVIIIASKLCIPSEAHTAAQWDVKAAQDRLRLDLYIESLCNRMQVLTTYDAVHQTHPDFWWAMRMIMEMTRTWYCKKIRRDRAPPSYSSSNTLSTPGTMPNSSRTDTSSSSRAPSTIETPDYPMANLGPMDMGGTEDPFAGGQDPFSFMREMDFDMDQFLDLGIWGHESYEGMGFGVN